MKCLFQPCNNCPMQSAQLPPKCNISRTVYISLFTQGYLEQIFTLMMKTDTVFIWLFSALFIQGNKVSVKKTNQCFFSMIDSNIKNIQTHNPSLVEGYLQDKTCLLGTMEQRKSELNVGCFSIHTFFFIR